jgi:cysteinyl-tRNA synthetase
MAVSFFNTMTRKVAPFTPLEEGHVRLYTCGPTVYSFAHIGNFRTYAFEDILRRWLEYRGFRVTHVMNITDVEDKIIRAHRATGKSIAELTGPYIQAFYEDRDALRILPAHHYPRATEYIDPMVALAQTLLDKKIAYRSEDGSIYYDISRFPRYGRLSHMQLDDLQIGERVAQDEYDKQNASDFALWKAWDPADGEIFWETALGKGRPGWHLECSAMSMALLGEHFDMHTGGEDNMFPHHENEIAQSEGATGHPFVEWWLHSRHLLVDHAKMAKSKGNFYTVRDLLQEHGVKPYALRYLYIASHYRQQLDFTLEGVQAGQRTVDGMRDFMRRLQAVEKAGSANGGVTPAVAEALTGARTAFERAMDDDLNTAEALAALHVLIGQTNRWMASSSLKPEDARAVSAFFLDVDRVLALDLGLALDEVLPEGAQEMLAEREAARKNKDWKRSDELRAALLERGVAVEDTPKGQRWKRA